MARQDPRINEAIKCGKDVSYFINNHIKIPHPIRGTIPFQCFPFQEEVLKSFEEHRFNIILKSRQLGISTVCSAWSLWMALFYNNKNILIISTKRDSAINLIEKIKIMIENLPPYLLLKGIKSETKQEIHFNNGSVIKSVGTSVSAGRGESNSAVLIDEANFIKDFNKIWTSLQPTISTGGKCVILSTPCGVGSLFHKLYVDAEANLNNFNAIRLPWTVHPERDINWYNEQCKSLTKQEIAQELECNFESSGQNFLGSEEQDKLRLKVLPPLSKAGPDKNIWIWREPQKESKYILSADISRGDAKDYSAFHVIDVLQNEVVAEYKGKIAPEKFGELLNTVGLQYNQALVCPENKSYGFATIKKLLELNYPNLYHWKLNPNPLVKRYYQTDESIQDWGFDTNQKTRFQILAKLEIALRNGDIKIYSSRFLEEVKTMVWHLNKWECLRSYNDDIIISLAIGVSLYEIGNTDQSKKDLLMTQALFSAMTTSLTPIDTIKQNNNSPVWTPMSVNGFQDNRNEFTRRQIKEASRNDDLNDFSWVWK